MGGKQSTVVRNSFDRIRGRKNRVVPIDRHRKAAKPWARNRASSLSAAASKPRRDWDDLVLEDLEDLPTDALFDLDAEPVQPPAASGLLGITATVPKDWLEDLPADALDAEPVQPPAASGPLCITATTKRRRDWDDLVVEDLENVPSDDLFRLHELRHHSARLPPLRIGARYKARSRLTVGQWNVTSIPGIVEPEFFSGTARNGEICNHSICVNDGISSNSQGNFSEKLTIPCVRRTTELDPVIVSRCGEKQAEFDSDSLTEVTSLDSMSIDSELLSILGGWGGEGGEHTHRTLSPQLSESDEEIDLDLSELVLMFAAKEEEEETNNLPDYVLFMSLPSATDLQ
jgi:hypothetical protein